MTERTIATLFDTVKVFPRGIMTSRPVKAMKGPGGVRGQVKGWSAASRRRFREWLLTHGPVEGYETIDATLTIPGDVMTVREMKMLWARWKTSCIRAKVGCVWRLEVQQRGQPHWHCLMAVPKPDELEEHDLERAQEEYDEWRARLEHDIDLAGGLHAAARGLPPGQFLLKPRTRFESWIRATWLNVLGDRGRMNGARQYAVDVERESSSDVRWTRYLCDHSSKSKGVQIAEGFGRHWGVIGTDLFLVEMPDIVKLHRKEMSVLLRLLRRRNRRSFKKADSPFGWKLAKATKRGNWGQAVWFGDQKIDARMISAAIAIANNSQDASGSTISARRDPLPSMQSEDCRAERQRVTQHGFEVTHRSHP